MNVVYHLSQIFWCVYRGIGFHFKLLISVRIKKQVLGYVLAINFWWWLKNLATYPIRTKNGWLARLGQTHQRRFSRIDAAIIHAKHCKALKYSTVHMRSRCTSVQSSAVLPTVPFLSSRRTPSGDASVSSSRSWPLRSHSSENFTPPRPPSIKILIVIF